MWYKDLNSKVFFVEVRIEPRKMSKFLSLEEKYGNSFSEKKVEEMSQRVEGWLLMNGNQITVTNGTFPERVEAIPYTLLPSILPKDVYVKAKRLQKPFHTVIYKAANDHQFMTKCFESVVKVDDFVRQLWNIYNTVREEGHVQRISLLLTRNDFLMEHDEGDESKLNCKHVEINTIAAGCGNITGVHRYSLCLAGIPFDDIQIPNNQSRTGAARGLVKAWELYGNTHAVILFVVGKPEPNTPGQRLVEKCVFEQDRSVRVMYRTFAQLIKQSSIGDNKELIVDREEVAVVYFRHGYSPEHYPTDAEFRLRLEIERSRAIKCPTVAFQLIGCKKVQQGLAEPGVLERYLDDTEVINDIRSTFVGLYKLDAEDSNEIISQALASPDKFVLKPQREGGGNNLFGAKLKAHLEKLKDSPDRSAWILMDRIEAARHRNRLIRRGIPPGIRNVVSELGIVGVLICTPEKEIENYECGYIMRTKPEESDEGGTGHGNACVDSVFLCDA